MPRAAAATAWASRSTPTHRLVPTASTRRWAGSPTTEPSPGTASSTCPDRARTASGRGRCLSARSDVDHEPGRVRQHGDPERALAVAHADERLTDALETPVDGPSLRDDRP